MAGRDAPADARSPAGGGALCDDVRAYDALGEHRTATGGDEATSAWLAERLRAAGFEIELQAFPAPLFEPHGCALEAPGRRIPVFPAWPVRPTPVTGLRAPLVAAGAADVSGRIVLVTIPYGPGAAWAAPRAGEPVMTQLRRGAVGVVAVTEGPTGEVIALNASAGFDWPAPVAIAAGRDHAALLGAAGATVSFTLAGRARPDAMAHNVVAHRPGRGKTIVVTTPKSGWFHCAAERGTGVAVFLALADALARRTDADLLFVATSGHELGYGGGERFVRTAPPPHEVRLWLHIGANVAAQEVIFADGAPQAAGSGTDRRWLTLSPQLLDSGRRAFAGLPGYDQPRLMEAATAVGELELFHAAGYDALSGIVGAGPLFHTPLDRAPLATSASIIEPVARACAAFLKSFA